MRAADFFLAIFFLALSTVGCRRLPPPLASRAATTAANPAAAAAPATTTTTDSAVDSAAAKAADSAAVKGADSAAAPAADVPSGPSLITPKTALLPALPLFAEAPAHPWNRLHQVLFARQEMVNQTACLASASCDVVPSPIGFLGDAVQVRSTYADTPIQLMLPGIDHLLIPPRREQVMAALHEALAIAPEAQPVAAALLQNDLWERFDAIELALAAPDREPAARAALLALRDGIGAQIRHLALPAAVIRALPANLPHLVAAHPDVLAGLVTEPAVVGPGSAAAWAEVGTRSAELPSTFAPPLRDGTRHAMMAGYRAVFRVFVAIPPALGGLAWLQTQLAEEPASVNLPPGTRLAILAQPLVISREGELVPLPLVTVVEARAVRAAAVPGQRKVIPGTTRLAELPFFVFEGRRQLLRAVTAGQPGLLRLAPAAPFPQGGTCSPRPELLQPLGGVCLMCHQPDSEHLTGTLSHGEQHLRLLRDASVAARATIEQKRERKDFKALQNYLGR